MEFFIKFISEMTFWNWLAIIAICCSLISVINAILSLIGRYKNWKATQSITLFKAEIEEYKKNVRKNKIYDNNPSILIAEFIGNIATSLGLSMFMLIIEGLLFFLFGYYLTIISLEDISLILLLNVFLLVIFLFLFGVHWSFIINNYLKRDEFNERIFNFVKKGKYKGFIEDENELLEEIKSASNIAVEIQDCSGNTSNI